MWGARTENFAATIECVRLTTLVDYNRAAALTSDTFETYASVGQSGRRMFTGAAFCPLTGFANLRTPKAYANIYLGQDGIGLPRWYMQSKGDGYAAVADGMCTILGGAAVRRQGRYSWHEGAPPTPMMSASDGICWIAGVGGKLTNDGDGVKIWTHDGTYLLDGESNGSGLWVEAECLDNR